MELSSSTVAGLEAAASSTISDGAYSQLVATVFQCALGLADQSVVEAIEGDHVILKESLAGLLSLLLEAIKCDGDCDTISGILEDHKMSPDRVQLFTAAYKTICHVISQVRQAEKAPTNYLSVLSPPNGPNGKELKEQKNKLRSNLGRVCSTLPHVVDVNWRLDYHVKNNHLERINKPVYLIDLKCSNPEGGGAQFACTQEQLQDLVSKLRDATKNLERCCDNN